MKWLQVVSTILSINYYVDERTTSKAQNKETFSHSFIHDPSKLN